MPTVQQIKEKRAQVWGQMTEIMERAKDSELAAEDRAAYDAAEKDLTRLSEDLERQERHEKTAALLAEPNRSEVVVPAQRQGEAGERGDEPGKIEQYRSAFTSYLRRGVSSIAPEERQLLETVDRELRAQASTPDTAGGFTIPEGFWAKVTEVQKLFGGVLSVANVLTTDTGAKLPWPTNDDTANVGEQIGENTPVAEQDLAFGAKELDAYIFSSKMVRLPLALLQDTGVDMEGLLARRLGERLGRIHNLKQTTGSGVDTPEGLITNARVGKTTAGGQVAAVTYDDLIDLEHSVDPAYRASGRCRWMFNDTTLASLRKVKDADGRPLWQPSLQAGVSDTLNGRPYTINQDMASLAASSKSLAFGDFNSGYVVRIVKNPTLIRLAERYAELLQVAFFAYDRMDAGQDDAQAYAVLQQAAV
jgi:HK97 family phage major capsid protein